MKINPDAEIARLSRARALLQAAAAWHGRLEYADAAALLDAWIEVWRRLR